MPMTFSKTAVPYWCSIWARVDVSISRSPRLPCWASTRRRSSTRSR